MREAVTLVARELMEAEISEEIGAGLGEVAPGTRVTHRNGYRQRAWETRVGELELLIPKERSGPAYFPSFLEPRRCSEQAIVAVVLEAYVNGVSTRKVDRLVEQLGIDGMTKDRVSAICRRWMSGSRRSAAVRWRAPTRISGSTRSRSKFVTTAGWCPRHWWSPTRCTRPGTVSRRCLLAFSAQRANGSVRDAQGREVPLPSGVPGRVVTGMAGSSWLVHDCAGLAR